MEKHFRHHTWLSLIVILLLLLAACGGGSDEAVQESGDADTGAVDDATDSESIDEEDFGATGSEKDSGGLPPTPNPGSKVNATRPTPEAVAAQETLATATPPVNRIELQEPATPVQLDIILLLDATGSMADELAIFKAGLESMGTNLQALPNATSLRYGFVVYRDHAKTEPSQIFQLTDDWEHFATSVASVTAVGGNDYAEDLNGGLYRAITEINWQTNALRLLILLGDAPPHLDAPVAISFDAVLALAAEQDIVIYTIGSDDLSEQGKEIYQQIAQENNGRFLFISKNPDAAQTVATAVYPMTDLPSVLVEILQEVLNE